MSDLPFWDLVVHITYLCLCFLIYKMGNGPYPHLTVICPQYTIATLNLLSATLHCPCTKGCCSLSALPSSLGETTKVHRVLCTIREGNSQGLIRSAPFPLSVYLGHKHERKPEGLRKLPGYGKGGAGKPGKWISDSQDRWKKIFSLNPGLNNFKTLICPSYLVESQI